MCVYVATGRPGPAKHPSVLPVRLGEVQSSRVPVEGASVYGRRGGERVLSRLVSFSVGSTEFFEQTIHADLQEMW